MNDEERRDMVRHDEGLYNLWRSSRKGLYRWVRENRELIDQITNNINSGNKQPHYLTYG